MNEQRPDQPPAPEPYSSPYLPQRPPSAQPEPPGAPEPPRAPEQPPAPEPTWQLPPLFESEPPPPARAKVGGWVWPVVAVLALIFGLIGGAAGGAAWQQWQGDTSSPTRSPALVESAVAAPLPPENGSVAAVAQALLPSTVQVLARQGEQGDGATGSGFVLDAEGHIVTNSHVVAGSANGGGIVVIDHAGNRHDAEIVGRSPVYDLAVLKVEPSDSLVPAALGSSRSLLVGETVVALGSPLGLSSTVTAGIVSALNRPVTTGDSENDTSFINAVQTDAAINPGNSGGPLVNLAGEVVGVNSAIATTGAGFGDAGNIGVGFAIPVEQVRITAAQILDQGEAYYPVIGAQVRTGERNVGGATIMEVNAGSPAADAGLQAEDVITKVADHRITDGISLIVAIRVYQPGETVEFTVERGGEERVIEITLGSEVG
ncbi:S1C family serine protease [Nocardioides limicola]|uniref:S1C family serine protease n=1 Tax=Nocardioides limicola TaxID=2803368 RepID=UPI00193B9DAC|nr:trypsin-like peptidase domain-containing protein [Nocardioides sp. DJM-14]